MAGTNDHVVIVVGAPAGMMQALKALVAQFPADLPPPVFIVTHMSPDATGQVLVRVLEETGPLPCQHATDGERFPIEKFYVAPSDCLSIRFEP